MDSILIMITLAFDRYDFKRKTQYPNGWNIELYKYADTLSNVDYFQIVRNKFKLASFFFSQPLIPIEKSIASPKKC